VTELCSLLDVSRSGYYRYLSRQGHDKDQETKERIRAIYEQRNGTYGYRRIEDELEVQYGEKVNHKKVLRLMQELGLKAVIRKKRDYRSTYQVAEADGRVADNLLNRDFTEDKPNQKWVTDVTQHRVGLLETFKSAFEAQKDAW
jgi:putative transposase